MSHKRESLTGQKSGLRTAIMAVRPCVKLRSFISRTCVASAVALPRTGRSWTISRRETITSVRQCILIIKIPRPTHHIGCNRDEREGEHEQRKKYLTTTNGVLYTKRRSYWRQNLSSISAAKELYVRTAPAQIYKANRDICEACRENVHLKSREPLH